MKLLLLIYLHLVSSQNVLTTISANESSVQEPASESGVSLGSIIAAVVGTASLLFALFVVVAFFFCCKSRFNSFDSRVDSQEETSIVSLTDQIELNNAQIIENPNVHAPEFRGKVSQRSEGVNGK